VHAGLPRRPVGRAPVLPTPLPGRGGPCPRCRRWCRAAGPARGVVRRLPSGQVRDAGPGELRVRPGRRRGDGAGVGCVRPAPGAVAAARPAGASEGRRHPMPATWRRATASPLSTRASRPNTSPTGATRAWRRRRSRAPPSARRWSCRRPRHKCCSTWSARCAARTRPKTRDGRVRRATVARRRGAAGGRKTRADRSGSRRRRTPGGHGAPAQPLHWGRAGT